VRTGPSVYPLPPEESLGTCGKCQQLEVLGGKEIIFVAFVDHAYLTVQLGVSVGPDLVHLAPDEIDVFVFAGIDTERVPTGFWRGRFLSHCSR
jgi:hypothetical protein